MVIALDRDVPATASAAAAGAPTTFAELRPAYLLGAPLAAVIAGVARHRCGRRAVGVEVVRPILVVLWAAAGLLLGLRRRRRTTRTDRPRRSAPRCRRHSRRGDARPSGLDGSAELAWDVALRFAAARPAVALHLLLGLVDGRLATPIRRNTVLVGYATGAAASVCSPTGSVLVWLLVVFWLAALAIGLYAAHARHAAGAEDRRRIWIGWGMAVAAEAAVVVIALRLLSGWPDDAGAVALAHRVRPGRPRLRDAATDDRPGRSPAHPHRRSRRADGARRRHLRHRHPRPRPHPDGRRTHTAVAVDGRRRTRCAALLACSALAD